MQEGAGGGRESQGSEPNILIEARLAVVREAEMKRILIVDDDESIRMLYAGELAEEGRVRANKL